jgi:4'-phosphopantetheinyl transferase
MRRPALAYMLSRNRMGTTRISDAPGRLSYDACIVRAVAVQRHRSGADRRTHGVPTQALWKQVSASSSCQGRTHESLGGRSRTPFRARPDPGPGSYPLAEKGGRAPPGIADTWLWFVSTPGTTPIDRLRAMLPAGSRGLRSETPQQRRRLESHAAMTMLSAWLLDAPVDDVTIARSHLGKPVLTSAPEYDVSLSHSGVFTAVSVSRGAAVGVDIELRRPALEVDGLAVATLAPSELAAWCQLSKAARLTAFLRFWCRKEAVLKALGTGLSVDMRSVVTGLDGRLVSLPAAAGDRRHWALLDVTAPWGIAASLAVNAPNVRLVTRWIDFEELLLDA